MVTPVAQDPPNQACLVVVVNMVFSRLRGQFADGTDTPLRRQQAVVLRRCNAEGSNEPLFPTNDRSALAAIRPLEPNFRQAFFASLTPLVAIGAVTS